MKLRQTTLGLVIVLTLMSTTVSFSQSKVGTFGIGLDVGGQILYGDRANDGIGLGIEGLASLRVLKFADLVFGLGYSQLRYDISDIVPGGGTNTTNLINASLKGNFELVSQGLVRPFVSAGAGLLNFEIDNANQGRSFAGMFFGGGGVKLQINPQFSLFVNAQYHFTTGDQFDNIADEGEAKDGYFNVRTGFMFSPNAESDESSQVIARQRPQFDQLESEPMFPEEQSSFEGSQSGGAAMGDKDMEEYVKLKSRIDELNATADSQDSQIRQLRNQLQDRKQRVSSLENLAEKQPPVNLQRSTSMSGFNEIYKEALAHYYNDGYSDSISLFRMLLQQYPDHNLSGSCRYWIAENLFALSRYDEAIAELNIILNSSESTKRDDALFLLGKAYLKVGSGDRAREAFSDLVNRYPDSEYASDARDYMRKL